jgi:hypothetical protein
VVEGALRFKTHLRRKMIVGADAPSTTPSPAIAGKDEEPARLVNRVKSKTNILILFIYSIGSSGRARTVHPSQAISRLLPMRSLTLLSSSFATAVRGRPRP